MSFPYFSTRVISYFACARMQDPDFVDDEALYESIGVSLNADDEDQDGVDSDADAAADPDEAAADAAADQLDSAAAASVSDNRRAHTLCQAESMFK